MLLRLKSVAADLRVGPGMRSSTRSWGEIDPPVAVELAKAGVV